VWLGSKIFKRARRPTLGAEPTKGPLDQPVGAAPISVSAAAVDAADDAGASMFTGVALDHDAPGCG